MVYQKFSNNIVPLQIEQCYNIINRVWLQGLLEMQRSLRLTFSYVLQLLRRKDNLTKRNFLK